MRLVLMGLRGSGKTTLGQATARTLGVAFLDLDALIEAQGRRIPEIFAQEGEAGFRRIEREMLLSLNPPPDAVIATGGGAVLHPDNRRRIAQLGTPVYLRAATEILAERIATSDRPRLCGPDALAETRELLTLREPIYQSLALHSIDTGLLSREACVAALVALVREKVAMSTRQQGAPS